MEDSQYIIFNESSQEWIGLNGTFTDRASEADRFSFHQADRYVSEHKDCTMYEW